MNEKAVPEGKHTARHPAASRLRPYISPPARGPFIPIIFFVERHWHYPVEILKITKGTFTVEINLETYTLHAGDICFINSEELHRLEGLETRHGS